MSSRNEQTAPSVLESQRDLHSDSSLRNDLDQNEPPASVAHATTRRAGRKSQYWNAQQMAILGEHTATFLACVEKHRNDLLGKNDRRSWPKPLTACLQEIQVALFEDEKMKTRLEEGIRKATGERSLSIEDLDHNKEQAEKNRQTWKDKVRDFYRNKLRDWRNHFSSESAEGMKPAKDDQSAYELLKKVLFTSFGPRDLFAQENADQVRERRDELIAERPELKSNNGAPYQLAISELWAVADQASYVTRAKEQFTDLERDEVKLSRALHWFLNTLSPKLGEIEMKLVYAYRHNRGGISVQSVDAACKSRANFDDKFESDHDKTWDLFSNDFLRWADKHIPQHAPKDPKPRSVLDIPKNLEGIPVFPNGKSSELTVAVMKDILTAYFKTLWFHSWPADLHMGAIPWSGVTEHPEDYYDLNRLPEGDMLQSPESMKNTDVVKWFEYFEERPRNIPPFVFFSKSEIKERLRMRHAQAFAELKAGDELEEDEPALHSSSPPPEIDVNRGMEDRGSTATAFVTPQNNDGLNPNETAFNGEFNEGTTPVEMSSSPSSGPPCASDSTSSHNGIDARNPSESASNEGATPIVMSSSPSSSTPGSSEPALFHNGNTDLPNPTQPTSSSPVDNDTHKSAAVVIASPSLSDSPHSHSAVVSQIPDAQSASSGQDDILDAPSTAMTFVPSGGMPRSTAADHISTQEAAQNAGKEDLPPPVPHAPVQEQVTGQSLTIRLPPISVVRQTTAVPSMDPTQGIAETKGKGRGGKGKGRGGKGAGNKGKSTGSITQNSDGPQGEETVKRNVQAGGRRKRKVQDVEEAEDQGGPKRTQTAGIATGDVGVQSTQRRSSRLRNTQK
ncbi:hypothetical protein K435DRAFT_868971 [Dendrothele bispora CBS 962.96]|uniref:Uncharacterized protein n=1 Tax=Dendrothele bispora (strain CBS 962.96) TaxID=1314807 RepID=A0A4S8LAE1_DENBC|nr:hypothetical protein K435DRAFT_868971 [Dendrothele bispora CBS 962.96]